MLRRTSTVLATAGITVALTLGACSSEGSDGEAPRSADDVEVTAVEGCEQVQLKPTYTEVSELPRCEPGAPSAQPLDEPAEIVVAVGSNKTSTLIPLLAAEALGELEKENIQLDLQIVPLSDALPLTAEEKVDVMVGSASVGLFNAIIQGFDIRQILGDGWQSPESKQGVWVRSDIDAADLKGKSIASSVGPGSSVYLQLRQILADNDLTLEDMRWETVDLVDSVTALENGAVDAATILDPFWLQLNDNPDFTFLAPAIRPGDNVGGLHAGPKLLKRPEVAEALVRAMIRTINTHFIDENWQQDEDLLAAISELNDQPVDLLKSVPGQIYSWDIPDGAATAVQELYIETGFLAQDEPVKESTFVDRSFIERAVGHKHE